jgi:hypothetical protein
MKAMVMPRKYELFFDMSEERREVIRSTSRPKNKNHYGIVNIVVPTIPNNIVTTSPLLSFSLIKQKANIAAKIGPVVKLIVLDNANGI